MHHLLWEDSLQSFFFLETIPLLLPWQPSAQGGACWGNQNSRNWWKKSLFVPFGASGLKRQCEPASLPTLSAPSLIRGVPPAFKGKENAFDGRPSERTPGVDAPPPTPRLRCHLAGCSFFVSLRSALPRCLHIQLTPPSLTSEMSCSGPDPALPFPSIHPSSFSPPVI